MRELLSVNGVTVTNQIFRALIHTAGLDQLLCSPGCARMICYIDVQYPPTVVAENDEDEEDSESGCWYCEEINRNEFFGMIPQECSPVL